jgi:hypothetical protein
MGSVCYLLEKSENSSAGVQQVSRIVKADSCSHPYYPCLVEHFIVEEDERPSMLQSKDVMVESGEASDLKANYSACFVSVSCAHIFVRSLYFSVD